ncbi:MAG: tetratricopeptide repeat protein [Phycisphaerae bacterium]
MDGRGIRAYYDRGRLGHYGVYGHGYGGHHYRDHHHGNHFSFGLGLHGEFYSGYYYPYGYASHYDRYYYRYPYHYVTIHDQVPYWTVYAEQPVVETVYVEVPGQTVYVEEPAYQETTGVAGAPIRNGVSTDFVGPSLPADGVGTALEPADDGAIQVAPQERIPVNNAWLATGENAFRRAEYEQARQALSYAVLEEPENGFAQLAYGLVHMVLKDYTAAADAVRRGLRFAPDVVDRPIDITRQFGDVQELSRHIQALQLHLAAEPSDADAWFVLGYVQYSSGRPEEAARAYSKAASLNPADPYAPVLRDAANRVQVR